VALSSDQPKIRLNQFLTQDSKISQVSTVQIRSSRPTLKYPRHRRFTRIGILVRLWRP